MSTVSITTLVNAVTDQLEAMVKRANLVPGYLDRVVYREYQNAQRKRFETQNSDPLFEGGRWDDLDPVYASFKKKKYASYPGSGSKINIRTNTLFDSLIGNNLSFHKKVTTDRSISIFTTVPYAENVDEHRTISSFSVVFKSEVYDGLSKYLLKGLIKGGIL